MNKFRSILLISVVTLVSATSINNNDKLYEITKNIELFVKTYKELNSTYVDDIDPSELMRIGIDAMVSSLDPYTNYISESQVESYRLSDDGTYKGIGADLGVVDDEITVLVPHDGSPAFDAGLRSGDKILRVNGLSTEGRTVEDIDRIVRGVPGSTLELEVRSNSKGIVENMSLTRSRVTRDNVPYYGMVRDGIGYVILTTFTMDASKNIASAIKELRKENNLEGIILDLRSNGGGLLREAIDVSNLFIEKGEETVTTKAKVAENDQAYRTRNVPLDLDIPLAVMINKRSASASEIVSGVVQDLDRGVLIGQRSFGKGLVQNTVTLPYNNRVKMTISKYYIPSGRCIQGVEYDNGLPVDIPDDQRSTFKTRNGRDVLDGGGVTPDIKMDVKKESAITKALKEEHLIFKYVNQYIIGQDSVKDAGSYVYNDWEDFKKFIDEEGFTFNTDSDKAIEALEAAVKNDFSIESADEIKALRAELSARKQAAWSHSKADIILEIEKEIISRYFNQSGRIKFTLDKDPEIQKAVEILTNPSEYRKVLDGR